MKTPPSVSPAACRRSHDVLFPTDLRRPGVDPGGVHAGGAGQPSGLGHVCVRLLLRHDLHLDGGVRLRGAPQPQQLGCSCELNISCPHLGNFLLP